MPSCFKLLSEADESDELGRKNCDLNKRRAVSPHGVAFSDYHSHLALPEGRLGKKLKSHAACTVPEVEPT